MTQALLAAGADPMARTESGDETPLHWAAGNGSPAVAQALLAAGADAMMRTAMGRTPWDIAQDNEKLKGTDAYWRLNDARFNAPGPVKSPSGGSGADRIVGAIRLGVRYGDAAYAAMT